MTADQLSDLELAVNEKIRSGCKMFPTLYDSKDDPLLLDVRRVENSFFALIVSLIC